MTRPCLYHIGALSLLSLLTQSDASAARSVELAFVRPQGGAARSRTTFQEHRYAAESSDTTSSSTTTKELSKSSLQMNNIIHPDNEWGIPHHSTLEPLGPIGQSKAPEILPNGGRVTLVGGGPGDPDLLTMAAYKILTEDPNALIISDRLISQEILDLIPKDCEVKIARKLPGCAELAQEEIYWWCHQGLKAGKHVIRLKIGDPFVFGRGGEEIITFRDFGVESKVIPGVSSAFSAPLLGGIPVTHRGAAQQVVMCTGYGREGTSPDLIQYHKEQTVVFLMAVGRLRELSKRLIEMANYPSDTPVGIIERAGCPNQRTVTGNLLTIADIAEKYDVKPPSVIVVGDVVEVLQVKDEESGAAITGLIQNMTSTAAAFA